MKSEEIDAVIAWVDGNDPVHQEKRARALAQIEGNKRLRLSRNASDPTRFADCGELYYNLRLDLPPGRPSFITRVLGVDSKRDGVTLCGEA